MVHVAYFSAVSFGSRAPAAAALRQPAPARRARAAAAARAVVAAAAAGPIEALIFDCDGEAGTFSTNSSCVFRGRRRLLQCRAPGCAQAAATVHNVQVLAELLR